MPTLALNHRLAWLRARWHFSARGPFFLSLVAAAFLPVPLSTKAAAPAATIYLTGTGATVLTDTDPATTVATAGGDAGLEPGRALTVRLNAGLSRPATLGKDLIRTVPEAPSASSGHYSVATPANQNPLNVHATTRTTIDLAAVDNAIAVPGQSPYIPGPDPTPSVNLTGFYPPTLSVTDRADTGEGKPPGDFRISYIPSGPPGTPVSPFTVSFSLSGVKNPSGAALARYT
ncbi:MAG: hypothetical protein JO069_15395, partial [Verrucomicrobia bacterium]|nr:hypothetical protein [Verrucomicrobiota bacterium]